MKLGEITVFYAVKITKFTEANLFNFLIKSLNDIIFKHLEARGDYMHTQLAIVIKLLLNYIAYVIDRRYIIIDQKKYIYVYISNMSNVSPYDLQNKKQYRNGQELCLRQEQ